MTTPAVQPPPSAPALPPEGPPRARRGSLTRETLLKMGVRIAIVIAFSTFLGYAHMVYNLRSLALGDLAKYVKERGDRERMLFQLAEDNAQTLKAEFLLRLKQLGDQDPKAEFDRHFVRFPDGVIRNRPHSFNVDREAGVYVGRQANVDADLRRRVLLFYQLATQYGPAWRNRFVDTYFTSPENVMVMYWPGVPWCQDAKATLDMPAEEEYVTVANPQNNPKREPVWTGVYYDHVAKEWMVSQETPVDVDGRWVATIGHDVLMEQLLKRTVEERLAGTYNVIFRNDGRLIAHPFKMKEIEAGQGKYNLLNSGDEHLKRIFETVTKSPPGETILDDSDDGEYLAVTRLDGPDWYFVTVFPKSILSRRAQQTAGFILMLGIFSLLMELGILTYVLRGQIATPLRDFMGATEKVAAGDMDLHLDEKRPNELGRLAKLFNTMAAEVRTREERLAEYNRTLEQKVEARTAELSDKNAELGKTLDRLKEAQDQIVMQEKMASLGVLTAGIAHEIKNPLNFVNNFSELSVELVEDIRSDVDKEREKLDPKIAEDLDDLLADLKQNVAKINEHGKRADSIVKGMLLHSRGKAGQRELTDVNALVDEYVRLAYHGLRAQNSAFNVSLDVRLDPAAGKVDVVPQEVSRVILNLVNNACYAAYKKKEAGAHGFEPTVAVSTKDLGEAVEIRVRDNGTGIPPAIREKIFTPFFTTKPTGEGTGLGLSLSYDVVVQQHHGDLRVESEEGEFTKFTVVLPRKQAGS